MHYNKSANAEIRDEMSKAGVKQWEVAMELGIAPTTLTQKLRKEVPESYKSAVMSAIETVVVRKGAPMDEKSEKVSTSIRELEEMIEEMTRCIEKGNEIIQEAQKTAGYIIRTNAEYRPKSEPDGANNYRYEPLRKRFCELVNASPLTQREIASKLGIAQCTLTGWLHRDLGMTTESLVKAADLFGVSLDYLTGRTDGMDESVDAEWFKKQQRFGYEQYLKTTKRKNYLDESTTYEAPWPYNLLDEIYMPYDKVPPEDIEDRLLKAIDTLLPRERDVVLEYFKEDKTMDEVGRDFNVTRERVRQITKKAVRKLRHPSVVKIIDHSAKELELMRQIKDETLKLKAQLANAKKQSEEAMAGKPNESDSVREDASRMKIEEMELSVRSQTCLGRSGIRTLGELENRILNEGSYGLERIRNLGRKSKEEILSKMWAITGENWEEIARNVDKKNGKC